MIKDFKYFQWGIYPKGTPVYGLYEPVTDCFILILDNLSTAVKLKYILSSRFALFVCRLDLARNFTLNLIDNECCENWSFVGAAQEIIIEENLSNLSRTTVTAKEFCQSSNNSDWDMDTEKHWAQFCHWIIKWIDQTNTDADNYSQAQIELAPILGLEATIKQAIPIRAQHQILSRLYWGQSINQTQQEINAIIAQLCNEVDQL
jgi:hypothetical protein